MGLCLGVEDVGLRKMVRSRDIALALGRRWLCGDGGASTGGFPLSSLEGCFVSDLLNALQDTETVDRDTGGVCESGETSGFVGGRKARPVPNTRLNVSFVPRWADRHQARRASPSRH